MTLGKICACLARIGHRSRAFRPEDLDGLSIFFASELAAPAFNGGAKIYHGCSVPGPAKTTPGTLSPSGIADSFFRTRDLSLLLRARMGESEASSAFPGQVLDALDDLAACGWLDHFGSGAALDLLNIPQNLREPVEQIIGSLLWRPRVDRALVEKGHQNTPDCASAFSAWMPGL